MWFVKNIFNRRNLQQIQSDMNLVLVLVQQYQPTVPGNGLTFCFMVGELMVGETEPPLFEVLHSKPFPALSPFYHEPDQ